MLILTPTEDTPVHADGPTVQLAWVRSADGQQPLEQGRCAASLLPDDPEVVLVLPIQALSWHRVALPKVSGARLRSALDGLLEEHLLGEPADQHFALEPGGKPGQSLWVAACQKAWLQSWLQALDAAGRPVSRIVPGLSPTRDATALHCAHSVGGQPWLSSASELGVRSLPLAAAAGLIGPDDEGQWIADPAVAEQTERVLDRRFEPVPAQQWLLRCARSDWNLAQFDLSLSSGARRGQRLRQALRDFRSAPAWRPARWGLIALAASLLVGLNATAWQERTSLSDKREAMRQTLQQTFPQVTLVLDAPVQMEKEAQRLQQASGQLSLHDLEAMLTALGRDAPPLQTTRIIYVNQELRLQGPVEQLGVLSQNLPPTWQAELQGDALSLRARTP